MISIGVVGYGYWGPNLVRNFAEASNCRLAAVCDARLERLRPLSLRYPGVTLTARFEDLLEDPAIDAIAVATPVSSHFPLALQALRAGKHVLVEKPLAASSEEVLRLIDEAGRRRLTLMVDHTFVYTGPVRKIHELIAGGTVGDVYYYDSARVNLGLFQHDVDVIWDLAVHDLSIMDYILPHRPCALSVTGHSHVPGGPENIAYITAFFEANCIAHIHVNWLSPVKVRRTLVGGSRKMIVYDDLEFSEKIKVYDKGITVNDGADSINRLRVGYRAGDMWAPQVDVTEALRVGVQEFHDAIENSRPPLTGGHEGLQVVRVLEAATRSMKDRGRLIELPRAAKANA